MNGLFSPDSKIMQALSRVADLMILNFFFLLTCIPVFTIGAATTALYTVCFRLGTDREEGLTKTYFRAFRNNFKQATVLWLIFLLCIVSSGFNAALCYSQTGILHYGYLPCLALLAAALMTAGYAFPLLSQFENGSFATVKNALLLSVGYLPRSVAVVALNVFPFGLLLVDLILFLQTGILWLTVYFAAAAYLNALLLKKVFAPYLPKEEEPQ